MFNFNHLYYFYLTARIGSVTAAARALKISQPGLSAQLKTLEGRLNKKFFRRVGAHMELTPDGEVAYNYCKKIFEAAAEFQDYLNHTDDSRTPVLRVGVCAELPAPFATELMTNILKTSSQTAQPTIAMLSGEYKNLLLQLQSGQLDVCLSHQLPQSGAFSVLATSQMPVGLVVSAKAFNRESFQETMSVEDFCRVLPGGLTLPSRRMAIRHEIDLYLHRHRIQRRIAFEGDSLTSVIRALTEEVGFGFVPIPYIAKEIREKRLIQLGPREGCWQHRVVLTSEKNQQSASLVLELKNVVGQLDSAFF